MVLCFLAGKQKQNKRVESESGHLVRYILQSFKYLCVFETTLFPGWIVMKWVHYTMLPDTIIRKSCNFSLTSTPVSFTVPSFFLVFNVCVPKEFDFDRLYELAISRCVLYK